MESPSVMQRLGELIELCVDGHGSFERALESETDPAVRRLLARGAMQHLRFLHELRGEVRELGGDPDRAAAALRPLHRNWIALRIAQRAAGAAAALSGCAGCEDHLLLAYADALAAQLPPRTYALLRRQELELRLTHDVLHALNESRTRAAG